MANDMSGNNMRYDGSEDLRLILERRQPDVVAVAGMEPSTFRLLEDVKRITENHTALTSDEIHVTLAPDRLARLYYNSERAMQEFPHLSAAERYAMSVGRCLQDVLAEYVAADRELLGLLLHRSQRLVPVDRRWAFLERELIIAVNAAGVNINDIAQSPHKQKTLSYVCGLGPRKAQLILNALSGPAGTSLIESRSDLIYRELVTKNIFVNCASFLRVWPAQSDILDSTRIHPEDYDLARKMAADALDVEDDDDDDHNYSRNRRKYDDGPSRYVAEVMKRAPEKLDDLILSEYAMELEKRLSVSKLFCLRFIKRELQHPYADSRHIYRDPDPKDVFEMLSGESIGDTLREDGSTIVVAQVARIRDKFAIARLDSGIDGFLNVANIDDRRVDVVSDELSVGETITAVVKKIDFDKLTVDLSTKPSDLQAAKAVLDQPPQDFFDRYFDFEADSICRSKNNLEKQISQMMQRSIPHPLFKQFNSRQAEKFLQRRKVGECVIRPSSLGHSYLTITWKIAPGLYHHISVQESDKPNNNELALGRLLMVRNQKFSDLDELLGVYLDPLIRKFEEARRYPKFYNPDTDPSYRHQSSSHPEQPADPDPSDPNESAQAMQDRLARHAKRYVSRIERHLDNASRATGTGSYLLALDYENPGCLAIHFKPNPKAALVKKWVIKVRPNEFCLGDRGRYPNVGTLINGFKTIAANISSANQNSAPTRPFQQLSSHYNHPPPPPPPPSQHQQQHQQHHHNYHHQPPPPPPPHTAPYPSYYHHHQQ
ncbi:Transcription elongation factor spt6 [Zancudomyces culisetae]|uniref:Transcription elongation factor spt6 n=1 Tax=Zancudomyces culisetae TaxID=1213189 RepID=A0A1R1PKY6_ZANCU|nr:Transcription elongation factor spt6 [Zancudomyces culisetae]|eukprot:OMH81625.1 Transcription elongation factor spt6 [Zancudomyces culisetae]